MPNRTTSAWGLAALGLFLLVLNQVSTPSLPIAWMIGVSCLTAGLVGLLMREQANN